MFDLERFTRAQDSRWGFTSALAEIKAGRKRSHWIWYIFPQLKGLGSSSQAQTFGLDGLEETFAYLQDATLRERLLTITAAVAAKLKTTALETLMGSEIDALKLISSMTLFSYAAQQRYQAEGLADYETLSVLAKEILAVARGQGYQPCSFTLSQL